MIHNPDLFSLGKLCKNKHDDGDNQSLRRHGTGYCLRCRNEYYQKNKDKIRQQQKKYYLSHPEKFSGRKYDPDYHKKYYQSNKEKIKAKTKDYQREYHKEYYQKNKEAENRLKYWTEYQIRNQKKAKNKILKTTEKANKILENKPEIFI